MTAIKNFLNFDFRIFDRPVYIRIARLPAIIALNLCMQMCADNGMPLKLLLCSIFFVHSPFELIKCTSFANFLHIFSFLFFRFFFLVHHYFFRCRNGSAWISSSSFATRYSVKWPKREISCFGEREREIFLRFRPKISTQ